MKKFLALVLTLAMVLTMSVSIFASPAAAGSINVAGKTTVDVEGVTYTVIEDLSALSTKGNYILSKDVAVAKNVSVVFAAGTVLNGNGYTISVANNSYEAPISKAPFVLAAGEAITITNVKFGTAAAPVVFESVAAEALDAVADDLSLFIEEAAGVAANFKDVEFNVYASDELVNVHTAAVVAYATGAYTFEGCVANVEFDTGNMAATDLSAQTIGYTGGFIAYAPAGSSVSFDKCETNGKIETDYRTGGYVGGLDGAASFTNSVNNISITNLTLVTGGFVGWVGQMDSKNNNLSAWTMDNCVNNGEITAYIGAYTIVEGDKNVAKTHADSGRTAGALVGYIYKNTTGTSPQWVVSNCVNTGNIYGEDRLAGMVGDNRLTHQRDEANNTLFQWTDADNDGFGDENGYKLGFNKLPAMTINCINYGDVVCIVKDAASGAHVLGGMFSRTQGHNILKNCVNYGSVNANGMKDGHLGGMIGNTSASDSASDNVNAPLELEGCVNYGLIINGRRIAGMIGASEDELDMKNCVNFGTIDAGVGSAGYNASKDDNGILAGGLLGIMNGGLHTITNSFNYAPVYSLHLAAGIAACGRANGILVIDNCANYGYITADDVEAAGMVAYTKAAVTIKNSYNAGALTAFTSFVVAQMVSRADAAITIENCGMFGTLIGEAFETYADGALGYACERPDDIACEADVMAHVLAEAVTMAKNKVATADAALAMLKAQNANAPVIVEDGKLVTVIAAIRGAQAALDAKNGKTAIRVSGAVAGVEFESVTFSYKVNGAAAKTANGEAVEEIAGVNYAGTEETKDAKYLGGDAIYTVAINDIATSGTVTVEVEMIATYKGVQYKSVATITIVDGVIANPAIAA